ncbi:MAG TPA: DinB family protein [Nostocaceae cyanobacterium]|nr:DinB family protein [Nostocaceae cyanobacterium]
MSESTHINQFRLMSRYNTWMNNQIYHLAASLTEEERKRDLGGFFKSIHGTLNHLLLTDRIWLGRFATSTKYTFPSLQSVTLVFNYESLDQILYTDFTELHSQRQETDQVIEHWTQELEPEILLTTMRYRNARNIEREHPLWFAVAHFFNHQTHHRSQVTTLLHQLGQDYGVTDFIAMYDVARDAF